MRVVMCLANDALNRSTDPKVAMVHGPPGTGKSKTIVALIDELQRVRFLEGTGVIFYQLNVRNRIPGIGLQRLGSFFVFIKDSVKY